MGTLYCTRDELKARRGIDDDLDDAQIDAACEAASRWIDGWCGTQFGQVSATRTYVPDDPYCLEVDDLVSVTTLKTDATGDGVFETTWALSDYQLLPINPAVGPEARPYTEIRAVGTQLFPYLCRRPYQLARDDRVEVAGVWGWPATPAAVKEAAAVLAGDLLKLGSMAFGIAGYGEYGAVRARANPIVTSMLEPYRKNSAVIA